jgi:chromosome segregation ATPase
LSKIPSILAVLKQQQESLRGLRDSIEREIDSSLEKIELIAERTKQINDLSETKIKDQSEKEKVSAELDATLAGLNDEKQRLQGVLQNQNDTNRSKQEQMRTLTNSQSSLEKDLQTAQTKLSITNGEIQKQTSEDERLTITLQGLETRHRKNVESLEEELGAEGARAQELQRQLKALRFLLQNQAIEIPELGIIKALQGRVATNLEFIQHATAMRVNMIEEVVEALSNRGVVRFNKASGEITVLQKLDI